MTQATTGKYAERIAKGAVFLDERQPGWRRRVDLDKLDLFSLDDCVLGQVYGGSRGVTKAGVNYNPHLAFDAVLEDDNFIELGNAWRQYIEATR